MTTGTNGSEKAEKNAVGLRVWAPAKVNLFFEILFKRDDGFHEIQTVATPIGLCDELEFWLRDAKNGAKIEKTSIIECVDAAGAPVPDVPTDDRNLIIRAAKAFDEALGTSTPVSIRVVKRIPSQAGLGGGSSDAAATLAALNELRGRPFSNERLREIGGRLGRSAVPPRRRVGRTFAGRNRRAVRGAGNLARRLETDRRPLDAGGFSPIRRASADAETLARRLLRRRFDGKTGERGKRRKRNNRGKRRNVGKRRGRGGGRRRVVQPTRRGRVDDLGRRRALSDAIGGDSGRSRRSNERERNGVFRDLSERSVGERRGGSVAAPMRRRRNSRGRSNPCANVPLGNARNGGKVKR